VRLAPGLLGEKAARLVEFARLQGYRGDELVKIIEDVG
jgi:hypothetical protein